MRQGLIAASFVSAVVLASGWIIACSDDDPAAPPTTSNNDGGNTSETSTPANDAAGSNDTGSSSSGGTKLVSGEGYAIVYADNSTIDARTPVTATFDGSGFLTAYKWPVNADESPEIGAATNDGAKTDGVVALGRWLGGPTAGKFFSSNGTTYAADDGFHWAVGKSTPEAATPKGAAVYELDLAGPATKQGVMTAGTVSAFSITFSANTDGGLPLAATSMTYDVGGAATAAAGGKLSSFNGVVQVRGETGLYYAAYFVGDTADRMIVAVSEPIHAALSLKKK